MSQNENFEDDQEAKKTFSQSVLIDFGQILAHSTAFNTNPHRVRLAKLREIASIPPDYRSNSHNSSS